ncbi:hypothetical protein GJAV_G00110100 [Gymnothorax javanicus]|nr:hypothetical protein GJAV_G00110100 [Gymnothorax javanicus]
MVKSCCVMGCTNRFIHGESITFHMFPKDPALRQRWTRAINRVDCTTKKLWEPGPHDFVCSEHFEESDFILSRHAQHKRLKKDAIPFIMTQKNKQKDTRWTSQTSQRASAVADPSVDLDLEPSSSSAGRARDRRITPPRLRVEMADEAMRQTRSQKRALEREAMPLLEAENKKLRLDRAETGGGVRTGGGVVKAEPMGRVSSMLNSGEVKATIKVELQTGDQPVDMSTAKSTVKAERRPPSPDDVIVLSDNESSSPPMNGLNHRPREMDTERLLRSSPEERERIIKQLKEELRLEEAKLVLLKKLRQSQIQKEASAQKTTGSSSSVATPPPLVRGSIAANKGSLQVVSGRSTGGAVPPPLVRGGQQSASKTGAQNSHIVMPPLVRGAQPIQVTPQQLQSMRQQPHAHSGSGPPPLLLAPRTAVSGVQVQGQRVIQPSLIRVANVANAGLLVNISQGSASSLKGSSVTSQSQLTGSTVSSASVNDSPASRQAAAKLALRKQLEKTLLEIPPPKPPAPELNFLPSAANNEFIYLVGLEEVVQNLLDMLAKGKPGSPPPPKEPYTCSQCQTDFTSRWRQEKNGGSAGSVMLKAEAQAKQPHARTNPVSLQVHGRVTPVARQHSAIKQSTASLSRSIQPTVVRGVTHSFSQTPQIQNAVAAAALVTRPGVTMAYVNPSLSAHKSSSAVDRQREYLLDMIPSRTISQAANAWK